MVGGPPLSIIQGRDVIGHSGHADRPEKVSVGGYKSSSKWPYCLGESPRTALIEGTVELAVTLCTAGVELVNSSLGLVGHHSG